jgi:aminopeptidase
MELSSEQITFEDLLPGARNAVRTCLDIDSDDRVAIITDADTKRIGLALEAEAREVGAETKMVFMEELGDRPIISMPESFASALAPFRPTATFFAARSLKGELGFRIPMRQVLIDQLNVRHGHMVGIDERLMMQGMMADYQAVSQLVFRVTDMVRTAREILVTNPKGTNFQVTLSPSLRWKPCPGIYQQQGQWGNLPEGETYTAPMDAEGILIVDVLGDYFSHKYGVLEHPVTFELKGGRIADLRCEHRELENELRQYLSTHENSARVGEFAIGANLWVRKLTGNLLQDEKIPGVHVAFGNPYPEETGAGWTAPTHIDVIPIESDVTVDGRPLMRGGRFEPEVLEGIEAPDSGG